MAYKRRLKFDKRIRFQKQMNIIYILLLVVLASLGVGYAYIKSNLNINGTANVTAARWDVHFTNLNVTSGSVTATTAATITNPTTVTFAATLDEPNDFYEFTVDVVNGGTMDAMIDGFNISPTLTTAQKKYLEYIITYSDGAELENKQELRANTTETLKVRFSYKENVDKTNYPTTDQTFNISFTMSYTQADNTSIPIDHGTTVYTVGNTASYIGQAMPNSITQYSSASDAMAAFSNRPFYLKHLIRNGIIEESYVEFVVSQELANNNPGMTPGTYALRGFATYDADASSTNYCKAEYYNTSTNTCINPYYESNKQVLQTAFGSGNCNSEYDDGSYKYLSCSVSGLDTFAGSNGRVYAFVDAWICNFSDFGRSYCEG